MATALAGTQQAADRANYSPAGYDLLQHLCKTPSHLRPPDCTVARKRDEFLARRRGDSGKPALPAAPFKKNRQAVVFSEARYATEHLVAAINQAGFGPVLVVDSKKRLARMPDVRINFDVNESLGAPAWLPTPQKAIKERRAALDAEAREVFDRVGDLLVSLDERGINSQRLGGVLTC